MPAALTTPRINTRPVCLIFVVSAALPGHKVLRRQLERRAQLLKRLSRQEAVFSQQRRHQDVGDKHVALVLGALPHFGVAVLALVIKQQQQATQAVGPACAKNRFILHGFVLWNHVSIASFVDANVWRAAALLRLRWHTKDGVSGGHAMHGLSTARSPRALHRGFPGPATNPHTSRSLSASQPPAT